MNRGTAKSLRLISCLTVFVGLGLLLWPDPVEPARAIARWQAFFRARRVLAAIPKSDILVVADSVTSETDDLQKSKAVAVVQALTTSRNESGDGEFPTFWGGRSMSCYWESQFSGEGRVKIGDAEYSYRLFVDGGILLDSEDVHIGLY